jgi:hypothetical protein
VAELVEAAEKVEAVVEPVVTEVVKTAHLIDRRVAFVAATLCTVGGGLIGSVIAERMLRKKYEKQAEDEINQMREHFRARLVAKESKPDLTTLTTVIEEMKYASDEKAAAKEPTPADPGSPNTTLPPSLVRNIFKETEVVDTWDWEIEKSLRQEQPDRPFVIHLDERHEREGWDEMTLTYYEADDVLCDANDKVVDDQELLVGVANLDRFGHGSKDANIVYIRNPQLEIDLEVVRSVNSYAEEVHGMAPPEQMRRRRGVSEPDE